MTSEAEPYEYTPREGESSTDRTAKKASDREEVSDSEWFPEEKNCNNINNNNNSKNGFQSLSQSWSLLVNHFHRYIVMGLEPLTVASARHPRKVISFIVAISLCLIVTGVQTNFNIIVDDGTLWTPRNSISFQQEEWTKVDSSGSQRKKRTRYTKQVDSSGSQRKTSTRYTIPIIFHANGQNVLGEAQIQRIFDVYNIIQTQEKYEHYCGQRAANMTGLATPCENWSPLRYWNSDEQLFHHQVSSDQDVKAQLSTETFPDGIPVPTERIMGHAQRSEQTGLLTHAQSFNFFFRYPRKMSGTRTWGETVVNALLEDEMRWREQGGADILQMEVVHLSSFGDEFLRAIYVDLPLVPVVFLIMSFFTCLMFWKPRNKVKSRSLLGTSAVFSVLLSLSTSFGILFIRGVPFSSITQLLPFVLFGIGLDDAFIIMGSYQRTNPRQETVERIRETIKDIGASITITSLTSTFAFALGCMSQVPAVNWLCLYAFPSVITIYLYQLTFFVACIALDEQRISDKRSDCCTCFVVVAVPVAEPPDHADQEEAEQEEESHQVDSPETTQQETLSSLSSPAEESDVDRFMEIYAEFLLRPWVKAAVVVSFVLLSVFCAMSASKMKQQFNAMDLLPSDSYVLGFVKAQDKYVESKQLEMTVYFRDVDQSKPEIKRQMRDYVNQLVEELDAIEKYPTYFWVNDLDTFANLTKTGHLPIVEQLDKFFSIKVIEELHGPNVVQDGDGNIVLSKVNLDLNNLDLANVRQQINTLQKQRHITEKLPINQGREIPAFFTYMGEYKLWSFYESCVGELVTSALIGVGTVSIIAMLLIPHWTATIIVLPMMCVLYIDMLGVMQWAGVSINPVSYVVLAMSIGLLVDFLMHVLLRYYELPGDRREKTIGTLRTMGSSILLGGITTFLGTVPLVFSTSHIFFTVFIAFMALVLLGATHGLVLLPVILATIGTEDQVAATHDIPPPTRSAHFWTQQEWNKKPTEDMFEVEEEEEEEEEDSEC